jgi:solute carrier family 25 phosphate transporter 23/24/25/41
MKRSDLVTELRKELRESQNERDKRIEELWSRLNPSNAPALDLKALQKGLRRIDHRKIYAPNFCLKLPLVARK